MFRFILYGLIGWCVEILWTGAGSLLSGNVRLTATTYLWMFPIYGAALFLEPVHDQIRQFPVWERGLIWMLLIFSLEFFFGVLLQNTIRVCPWDYSDAAYNIAGVIRLDYAPAWFTLGLLFEKIHDYLVQIQVR